MILGGIDFITESREFYNERYVKRVLNDKENHLHIEIVSCIEPRKDLRNI